MHTVTDYPNAETTDGDGGPEALHSNTGHNSGSAWVARAFPGCGEGSVALRIDPEAECSGRWERLSDDERERLNWERSNHRAAGALRRYMVENELVFMWVLTCAGDGLHGLDGRAEVMRRCGEFARVMRAEMGVEVYAYSPELHPGGHGWHVNFFVGSRLPHGRVAELWGHGHVWVSDWRKKVRRRPGLSQEAVSKHAAMSAARYASKYATKDWSVDAIGPSGHRYERSEGHDPQQVLVEGESIERALAGLFVALDIRSSSQAWVMWSDDVEGYEGPPWVVVRKVAEL